jgi:hypothetical protein
MLSSQPVGLLPRTKRDRSLAKQNPCLQSAAAVSVRTVFEARCAGEGLFDRMRGGRRFDDTVMAVRARVFGPHHLDDHESRGLVFQLLRDGFADPSLRLAARTRFVGVRPSRRVR